MKNLLDIEPLLRASTNALKRTSEFYNIETNIDKGQEMTKLSSLTVKDLTFSYNNKDDIIKGINFSIKGGEKIMITGPSGSGKSTIAKMIMRYLDAGRNQILIDEKDILCYSSKTIRENICYVSQCEMLFTDTLYNNVVLYRDLKGQVVNKVFDITYLNEVFERRNLNDQMLVEENGYNLSGGEKQRIMIARALLKGSMIYIFDESMSEMNVLLEREILKNIFFNYNDKTIIVISHRLDNEDLFDNVIVVNGLKKYRKKVLFMTLLSYSELNEIHGGGFGIAIAIAGLLTFLIGVVDGYVRPLKCN